MASIVFGYIQYMIRTVHNPYRMHTVCGGIQNMQKTAMTEIACHGCPVFNHSDLIIVINHSAGKTYTGEVAGAAVLPAGPAADPITEYRSA